MPQPRPESCEDPSPRSSTINLPAPFAKATERQNTIIVFDMVRRGPELQAVTASGTIYYHNIVPLIGIFEAIASNKTARHSDGVRTSGGQFFIFSGSLAGERTKSERKMQYLI